MNAELLDFKSKGCFLAGCKRDAPNHDALLVEGWGGTPFLVFLCDDHVDELGRAGELHGAFQKGRFQW